MSDSHGHCDAFLPIIGILCVDIAQPLQNLHGNEVHSYLAASYVKYLETAGAKVIPIWLQRHKFDIRIQGEVFPPPKKIFPFFGAQFHPERVMFEHMGPQDHCHHCISCFKLNQYFARFFVDQCSKSDNRFANYDDELRHSIYNFPSIYTAPLKLHWQHCFLFKADVDYKSN
uniref:Folate gamma-glutamyl hydrolase n=1 Tax=Stomoxys calcitrans TaxID=35570 RepID=A0A1I8NU22_STOCA